MRFGPVRLLALLTLLLAAGLAWLWLDQHAQVRNVAWVAPKALPPELKVPASAPPGGAASDTAQFALILERPLFAPDRRPPPPPAPPPPPDPMANIQISGIFSGANAGILARVDGTTRRVKVNETVGSWTLKSIEGRDVTFSQGEENRTLRLSYAPLGQQSPQAAEKTVKASGAPAASLVDITQNRQDEARETLRRRNAIRAAKGLPLVTE
ncbi:MAG: hypothetical protein ABI606_10195 [Rhodoferax sp.]